MHAAARAGVVVGGSLALALGSACFVVVWNAVLSSRTRQRLRKGARLVKLGGGAAVAVYEAGAGKQTVVLDAGLGMTAVSWSWIMEEVSKHCKVIAFDRPGLGASPPQPGVGWMRRVDDIVELNRSMLSAIGVSGPVILVGHSTSGMHARLHAYKYPKEISGLVLVDTAHEGQLSKEEGNSVYNSYPDAAVTEAKLARVRWLWNTGLLRLMFLASGPSFRSACRILPILSLVQRLLDMLGGAAARAVLQNDKIIGPHLPRALRARFLDEQLSLEGMAAMIAEHGSQRASMEYMRSLGIMRDGSLGDLPLTIVSRDPAKGAGGGLYPNARGDPGREALHEGFQKEQEKLSRNSRRVVVEGAGHGSLLFVQAHAERTAEEIVKLLKIIKRGPKMMSSAVC